MPCARLALSLLMLLPGIASATDDPHVCRAPGDNGLYGYGDRLCRLTIPARYLWARPFTETGVAVVTVADGHEGLVDRRGKEVLPPIYRDIRFGPDGQVRASREGSGVQQMDMLFDLQGHPLLPAPLVGLGFFHDGLAVATTWDSGSRAQGFIDRSGHFVIPPRFNAVSDFARNGLAAAWIDHRWGFIDRQGKVVIPAQYDFVAPQFDYPPPRYGNEFEVTSEFGFGDAAVARVNGADGWQLIDASGHRVGSAGWSHIGEFGSAGLATVTTRGDRHDPRVGLVDMHGSLVLAPTYDAIGKFENGYAAVRKSDQWGFIDAGGKLAVALRFSEPPEPGFSRHGLAKVLLHPGRDPADPHLRSMGFGYIDTQGNVVIDKDDYDRVDAFQDDMADPLARVTKGGRTAYLDTRGKLALGWFDGGTSFGRDGLAAVKSDGKFGYIDRGGRFVIAPAYDDALRFDGDTAAVKRGAKWGVIDHAGKIVVPFEYDRIAGFGGEAVTLGTRGGREVGVDRAGHAVDLPPPGPLRGVPIDDL